MVVGDTVDAAWREVTAVISERDLKLVVPFLKAIVAEPSVALPRLVLADWLEERGYDKSGRGQRWAAELGKRPEWNDVGTEGFFWSWIAWDAEMPGRDPPCYLNPDIFSRIPGRACRIPPYADDRLYLKHASAVASEWNFLVRCATVSVP